MNPAEAILTMLALHHPKSLFRTVVPLAIEELVAAVA
jgi:hypothetical protein